MNGNGEGSSLKNEFISQVKGLEFRAGCQSKYLGYQQSYRETLEVGKMGDGDKMGGRDRRIDSMILYRKASLVCPPVKNTRPYQKHAETWRLIKLYSNFHTDDDMHRYPLLQINIIFTQAKIQNVTALICDSLFLLKCFARQLLFSFLINFSSYVKIF